MHTAKDKKTCRDILAEIPQGRRVLVPTMGALHDGHAQLLREARQLAGENGTLVCSIFLNPIQFNQASDLSSYPKTLEQDLALCEACGVDVVFLPDAHEMYSDDRSIIIDENALSTTLCGASRPGHFAGVCTVVAKLFNIIQPTHAVFGKKDYQQLAILRRMVRDLDFNVNIIGAEIVRADNGLAFSSRNVRLTPENRDNAPLIRRLLVQAKERFRNGERPDAICKDFKNEITLLPDVKIDYVHIVNAETMQTYGDENNPALMAVAIFFGDVRLIDNIELS